MSKKKVENLLKGVAITGATVGGASVLGDANLAYAAELGEEEANALSQGEMVLQVAKEQTEQQLQTSIESVEEKKAVDAAEEEKQLEEVDLLSQAVSDMTANSESAATSESTLMSDIEVQSESAGTSLSSEESLIESTSESAATSLSTEESEIASTSTSASESADSENASMSTAISEAEEAYNSASTSFSEEGYQDDYLEDLIHQIEVAKAEVEAAQQKAIDGNQYLNHDSKYNNYYGAGDKLANLLIQYAFYQEGYVGEIMYSKWDSSSYTTNSVKVTYIDSTGATKNAYFDYVTVDKDGNALVSGFYDSPERGSQHDNPYVVAGIMVVKKTAEYKDACGNTLTWEYKTEIGADEKEQTVCHYYENGCELSPNVTITLNADGTYTAEWPNATEVAVTEENPGKGSYTYVGEDGRVYHDLSKWYNYADEYNRELEGFTRNSKDNSVGVVLTDEQGNTTISTLVDRKGNTLKLVYKDTGLRFWEEESRLEIGGQTYYFDIAKITRNFDGTYTLITKPDTYIFGNRKTEITLYTAANAPTSTDVYAPGFVARKSDGTEKYKNNFGVEKDGNFGVKGYSYFTLDDFNKGRDEYHEQRSEVTSLSDSLSDLKSTSQSLFESATGSETASESTAQSRAESLSTSAVASESAATSRVESLADSQAASTAKSTSISESLEASLSHHTSESMSLDERIAQSQSAASESARLASESVEASTSARIESESTAASESERLAAESTAASESERLAAESTAASESARLESESAASESARLESESAASESARLESESAASESARLESESAASESARLESESAASESARIASESADASTAASTSERIASESADASTAASTSERIASESAEASTAQSESERIAQSTSISASVSESISSSESANTSASTSASTSAAASEAANNSGNSGNGGIGVSTYTSASEINENATNAAEYNEVNNAAGTNVNTFNEVGGAGIEDAQVPLAVRLDDDLVDEDVAIKDEETPLAVEKSGVSGRAWWYWILIIISAITGNVAKNKEKATQKEMEEKDK